MYSTSNVSGAFSSYSLPLEEAGKSSSSYFVKEIQETREKMRRDFYLASFAELPDPFIFFIQAEKCRLALNSETRNIRDPNGKIIGGFKHNFDCIDDPYHPKYFQGFPVKGYWIPEEAGQLFSSSEENVSPLMRTTLEGKREVLFLVHPKSEGLYRPLMEAYVDKQVSIPAVALSSYRTLLISPSPGKFVMVKVSLDKEVGGVLRILSKKESTGSVACSSLLEGERLENLSFIKETNSFIPHHSLVREDRTAGMIIREIPSVLSDSNSKSLIFPFFSLFGKENRSFLDALIFRSGKTPTNFIVEDLLKPICDLFVIMIFDKNISLEIHAQNLLIVLNEDAPPKFMYRDMGGVNPLLSEEHLNCMPKRLRKSEYFYTDTHLRDTADVLEGFAMRVLFNLTKQFVKCEKYGELDPDFLRWKEKMARGGYLRNWTLDVEDTEGHQVEYIGKEGFYRYGYFEQIFGKMLLDAINQNGVFEAINHPQITYENFKPYIESSSCYEINWFYELIANTYGAHLFAKGF